MVVRPDLVPVVGAVPEALLRIDGGTALVDDGARRALRAARPQDLDVVEVRIGRQRPGEREVAVPDVASKPQHRPGRRRVRRHRRDHLPGVGSRGPIRVAHGIRRTHLERVVSVGKPGVRLGGDAGREGSAVEAATEGRRRFAAREPEGRRVAARHPTGLARDRRRRRHGVDRPLVDGRKPDVPQ